MRAQGLRQASSASGSGGSPSRHCTGARAWRGPPAAASRSNRRGRRRRGACRGSRAAPITFSARSTCPQIVAFSAWSSPSGWKNGTISSSSDASSEADEVLGERQQRPEDDVAVRVAGRMLRSRSKNMNHCGQSPSGFCGVKTRSSRSRIGSKRPEREQHLDRPLADVAGAPAAAGVLLQPARRQVVDQRVVREPGQDFLRAPQRAMCLSSPLAGAQRQRASHAVPELIRLALIGLHTAP